ncbi:MAG: ribosome maturation factor RimM [candidate division KSB1 bacterium]|nr:ribosome maturation factor RimM [candidate division KSB1 bacterium]
MSEERKWVSIGVVSRPHGTRGELRVLGVDDGVARFRGVQRVVLEAEGPRRAAFAVERFRASGRHIWLKLQGIESRDEAEAWRSSEVLIPIEDVPPLEDDAYYAFQLVGLAVYTAGGRYLGKVTEILELPANDVWVVHEGDKETLIPAVAEVVVEVNLRDGIIRVRDMEGLTE